MPRTIARPGTWTTRFFAEATPYDLATAGLAGVAGIVGAWKFFRDDQPAVGWLLVGCAVLACGAAVTKAVVAWRQKEAGRAPHLLETGLHVLYAELQIAQEVDSEFDHGLRITVHVPISGDRLQQVLDYVGDQRDGKRAAGRVFPANAGIVGRALQRQRAVTSRRRSHNYNAYIRDLQDEWNYSKDQAERVHPGTMAWMAVPVFDGAAGRVRAVIYLDSTDPDYFTDIRQNMAVAAATGIANYLAGA